MIPAGRDTVERMASEDGVIGEAAGLRGSQGTH